MSDNPWTDRIVGERMAVDQEFSEQIQQSRFSNQQWSLVMTATEFEIEHPDDPDRARIVANTDKLDGVSPNSRTCRRGWVRWAAREAGAAVRTPRAAGCSTRSWAHSGWGGDGGSSEKEQRKAAERLTQEYADELQSHLESKGNGETARHAAADGQ